MPLSVKLDAADQERLRRIGAAKDRSTHYLMREAIRQFLDREEARQSFLAEADAAWRNYRETGQHNTGDEIANWLETWGSDDEKDAPVCHD
jgi:predicted transcriptional regulator